MLYMVEMELPDRSRLAEWHAWYTAHIGKLLTADGYDGAQRFEALGTCDSPFLAIHDVVGPELFTSAGYKAVGGPSGTGEWQKLMTNWHRNLFRGMDMMPEVAEGQTLALLADGAAVPEPFAARVSWVDNVGLDGSIPRRGVLILDAGESMAGLDGVVLYKPITGKIT
jgi:hypothetical protein